MCNQMLASLPYYIEEASLNVYSLEELSYYIENNLYLVEIDFMNEELCTWVDKELGLKDTAAQLREICRQNGTLAEFVECLLSQSGYLDSEQMKQITAGLADMEHKSEFECVKMKADRYVENGRYISAIYEYRRLLGMETDANEVLLGNIWHNLGKAYAGLFLYGEAAQCLKRAYELNQNTESLRECLSAYRYIGDEHGFERAAAGFDMSEEERLDFDGTLALQGWTEDIESFEQQLEELFAVGKQAQIEQLIDDWKETYRKNCRI